MPEVSEGHPEPVAVTFANTGYDADDPRAELAGWQRERLAGVASTARSVERLAALQAAVCAVFDARIGGRLAHQSASIAVLNDASLASPVSPTLTVDASGRVSLDASPARHDLRGLLAEVARSAMDVVVDRADRLRRCDGPNCGRYFLSDRAHRNWCSLGCGNRARVARHYRNHPAPSAGRRSPGGSPGEAPAP